MSATTADPGHDRPPSPDSDRPLAKRRRRRAAPAAGQLRDSSDSPRLEHLSAAATDDVRRSIVHMNSTLSSTVEYPGASPRSLPLDHFSYQPEGSLGGPGARLSSFKDTSGVPTSERWPPPSPPSPHAAPSATAADLLSGRSLPELLQASAAGRPDEVLAILRSTIAQLERNAHPGLPSNACSSGKVEPVQAPAPAAAPKPQPRAMSFAMHGAQAAARLSMPKAFAEPLLDGQADTELTNSGARPLFPQRTPTTSTLSDPPPAPPFNRRPAPPLSRPRPRMSAREVVVYLKRLLPMTVQLAVFADGGVPGSWCKHLDSPATPMGAALFRAATAFIRDGWQPQHLQQLLLMQPPPLQHRAVSQIVAARPGAGAGGRGGMR